MATGNSKDTCRLCEKPGTRLFHSEGGYDILRCPACGFFGTWPVPSPSDLRDYYSGSYFRGAEDEANAMKASRIGVFDQALAALRRNGLSDGARLLDIGCAYGAFVRHALRRGMGAEGCEISAKAAERARAELGGIIHEGDIATLALPADSYDAATMLDVLEHLPDFHLALRAARRILRDGGLILVRVPNASFHAVKVRLCCAVGAKWKYGMFLPPAHLNHFPPPALALALKKNGFHPLDVCNGYPDLYGGTGRKTFLRAYKVFADVARAVSRGGIVIGNTIVAVARKTPAAMKG